MTSRQANSVAAPLADAVGLEQAYVDMLYRLLDRARERAGEALTQTLGSGGAGGTFQARVERDFTAAEQSRRLAQLNAVERGLVFGRIDGHRADGHQPGGSAGEPGNRSRCTSAGSACATTSMSRASSTGARPHPIRFTPPPRRTRTA